MQYHAKEASPRSRGKAVHPPLSAGTVAKLPTVALEITGKIRTMIVRRLPTIFGAGALLFASAVPAISYAASDPGKKACAQEARRLCPAEMKSMSRKKVEACMIAKVEQTSPVCHAAMLKIKAQREAAVATKR